MSQPTFVQSDQGVVREAISRTVLQLAGGMVIGLLLKVAYDRGKADVLNELALPDAPDYTPEEEKASEPPCEDCPDDADAVSVEPPPAASMPGVEPTPSTQPDEDGQAD